MTDQPTAIWQLAEDYPEVRQAYGAPAGVPLSEHVQKLTREERQRAARRLLSTNPPGGTPKTR